MHHIRKLELFGFKSFCDRTRIVFHEGITAIVGPNGCGKSNIADAIGWVVGEQSAKTLRADRMEGVIFSGTQSRKPTNVTEVVLTLSFDPSYPVPGPLSLNPEEFTVSRRLYRSGESEYYLDGRRCRLKDISALFEGSGLGPNSYALIEQGRIGQILSSKPADRRSLIEEAARITLFKSRRYAAEMKLEMAQANLLRVSDIIREVARQLNSLRRQAAKARRYSRLREELRGIHKLKYALERMELQEKTRECMGRFDAACRHEQAVLAALTREEAARSTCRETCGREETAVGELRDRVSSLKVAAGALQSERQRRESRKQDLQNRLAELERDIRAVQERAQLAGREHERLATLRRSLSAEIAAEQAILEREQARSDAVQEAIVDTEAKMEELRAFLLNRAGQLSELRTVLARCQENLQRIAAHSGRVEEERQSQARERAALSSQLGELRGRWDKTTSQLKDLDRQRAEAERRAAELDKLAGQVAAELAALQEEHSIMQHRHSSLDEVERRRSNYSEGVQKYLSAKVPGEEALSVRTLADHIETDPLFEAAVEDYLNDPLQYILVPGLDEAKRSIERLKRVGAGRCTFMTLTDGHLKESRADRPALSGEGVIGYLDQVLRMRDDVKQAFERALPEYASTIVVSDLNTAFRAAESTGGSSFLTLAGEAYSPRGTLSAVGERKSMAGFLSLKREKRDLEERLAALRERIEKMKEELSRVKQDQAEVAEALRILSTESRDRDIEFALLRHQVERLEAELQKTEQTEKVSTLELSQLQNERVEFETRLNNAESDIGEIERRSRSGGEEIVQLAARLESLKTESAALSKTLAGLTSAYAVKQERFSATETDLQRLSGEIDEMQKRVGANQSESAATLQAIAGLEQGILEGEKEIAEHASQIAGAEAGLNQHMASLAAQREELAALEERLRELHAEREAAMDSRSRVEIERTRLETDSDHLEKSCRDEFHLPLSQIVAQIPDDSRQRPLEEVTQAYQQLRERVENFGPINMRALEEYQELDERHTFLTRQRSDIDKSIADTQRAIAEINRRSVEQFREAFTVIRQNFAEVFRMLFSGGQCDLRMLDEEDVLESGIDIIAQPPGKRLQNVLLLSGGEKALTALALLVAIFRYRPSPFCVMDEVDAPLDDANIQRFTSLIKGLSEQTQFILITHNKKTMEIAEALYGVTMDEPGISQVVSVNFRPQLRAVAS
jgi:chromosome segregation protein